MKNIQIDKFKNTQIIAIITLACLFLLGIPPVVKQVCALLYKSSFSFQKHYYAHLETLKQEVWKELEIFGVTPTKINQSKEKDYNIFLQMCSRPFKESVSEEVKALAIPIFKEFGVDISTIRLIKWDQHVASASDKVLYINEPLFLKFSEEAQKYFIAHELQHIIFQDHSTDFFITGLLPESERGTFQASDHPMSKYYRFRELRADLLVALKSDIWAHRYKICMNELQSATHNSKKNDAIFTHPSFDQRIAIAAHIIAQKTMPIFI